MEVDLSQYDNKEYKTGKNVLIRVLWYIINALIFQTPFFPFYKLKTCLLRFFGTETGHDVIIKPSVNIKYPWKLKIGSNVWIGEKVWIDNLTDIIIGNNVCISQGAMLLTGNHDYKKITFDLITGEIVLEDGVWIGAKSIVCPGIKLKSHAVLSVGSIAAGDLEAYYIYQGNPALKTRKRVIK